jgi:hypothetical protein
VLVALIAELGDRSGLDMRKTSEVVWSCPTACIATLEVFLMSHGSASLTPDGASASGLLRGGGRLAWTDPATGLEAAGQTQTLTE